MAFHWHGETFDLPGTPIRLSLRTSQNPFDKS